MERRVAIVVNKFTPRNDVNLITQGCLIIRFQLWTQEQLFGIIKLTGEPHEGNPVLSLEGVLK